MAAESSVQMSFSFAYAAERAIELRAALAGFGVLPSPGSWLGRVLDSGDAANGMEPSYNLRHEDRRLQAYRDVGDVILLANTVLNATPALRSRRGFLELLRLLGRGDGGAFAGAGHSMERDRSLELHCAGWLDSFASDVDFAEPDVVCTYRGSRWGVACKNVRGRTKTTVRRIREGVEQFDRAGVRRGLVLVRVTDLLDHDVWWGPARPGGTEVPVFRKDIDAQHKIRVAFAAHVDRVHRELRHRAGAELSAKRGIGVQYVSATATMVGGTRDATPTLIPCGRTQLHDRGCTELAELAQQLWEGFGRALGASL